jgi:high-affinity nickel-transport protein
LLTSFGILALSFLLGMRHATDADHVVAVTTIVSRQRSLPRAAAIGALWGLGHTVTLLAVGGMMIVLGLVMPPWLGLTLELLVAVMLVVLGVVSVVGGSGSERMVDSSARPLIASPLLAAGYLALFGVGTIAGMVVVTVAIALPSLYATHRIDGARNVLRYAAGVASIAFGLYLAHHIGFSDGLFTGNPVWTPK